MVRKKQKSFSCRPPARRKIGRCQYVVGYDNKPIIGLSWDKSNGYYYPTHFKETKNYKKTGKRPNFTKELHSSISLFEAWKNKNVKSHISIPQSGLQVENTAKMKRSPEYKQMLLDISEGMTEDERKSAGVYDDYTVFETVGTSEDDYPDGSVSITSTIRIDENAIIDHVKELFANYPPSEIAQKFGMPTLANINYADDLQKPNTLRKIGECYFNRIEFTDCSKEQQKEIDKTKAVWREFCQTVKVKTAKDLTKKHIKTYYNDIYSKWKKKNYSTTWIKGRFERVKRVFNHSIKELDNVDDIIAAKQKVLAVLTPPKSVVKEGPYRIPKKVFLKALKHSNAEERCMWMLSMNLAYYSVDIVTLPVSAINLSEKTVIYRRTKTGCHRSGVLWDKTIDAIKDYRDNYPHNGKTLFVNITNNAAYVSGRVRKRFNLVLQKAGLKEGGVHHISHRNFRDSFKSICAEMGVRNASVNAVMGHRTQHDEYIDPELHPKIAKEACTAVYQYYFPD